MGAILGFFQALFAGIAGTLPMDIGLGIGIVGLPGIGAAIGAFIAANWLTLALAGVALAVQAFQPRPSSSATANIRIDAGSRRHAAATVLLGGQVIFGAFDGTGAFWYVVVHCDERIAGEVIETRLADIQVTLDGSHRVTTDAFKATTKGFLGILPGGRNPFYSVWTRTYTADNPVPPPVTEFNAAFTDWTDDHLLVGTTYSVVKIDPVAEDVHGQIYKWTGGALGLSEPPVTIVAQFAPAYDPRDPAQNIDDESTWQPTRNCALRFAWNRYRKFGFARPMDRFNWDEIATAADICDIEVLDKNGVPWPRYECGLSFDDTTPNGDVEAQILAACDGQVFFDDDGKIYIRVGHYEAPEITVNGRDIMRMEFAAVEDGETPLNAFVVIYTEPDYDYVQIAAAPYYNEFYVAGTTPRIHSVPIPSIQSHNQAVRIEKALSRMMAPRVKPGPTIGPKLLLLRDQAEMRLDYAPFSGFYRIAGQTTFDPASQRGRLAGVPMTSTDWDLLAGEEGDRPRRDVIDDSVAIPDAENVVVVAVPVAGSASNSVQIKATFEAPPSVIYDYLFEYAPLGTDPTTGWPAMTVDMSALTATVLIVDAGATYEVRWRTHTSGDNYGDYSAPIAITATSAYSLNFATAANSQYLLLLMV